MNEFEKQQIKEFAKKVNDKIEELKNLTSDCWVCEQKTNSWVCIMPEYDEDGLGFGSQEGKTRVVFAPVCKEHDLESTNIKAKLIEVMKIKAMKLKN